MVKIILLSKIIFFGLIAVIFISFFAQPTKASITNCVVDFPNHNGFISQTGSQFQIPYSRDGYYGHLNQDDQEKISRGDLSLLEPNDYVTTRITTTISEQDLQQAIDLQSLEIYLITSSGSVRYQGSQIDFDQNSFEISFPAQANLSKISFNVRAPSKNDRNMMVDVCSSQNLTNALEIIDITSSFRYPDCSQLTTNPEDPSSILPGQSLQANFPASGFDNNDPYSYLLRFQGEDAEGNRVQEEGSGGSQTDLNIQIADISTKILGSGGSINLYRDIRTGSTVRQINVCSLTLDINAFGGITSTVTSNPTEEGLDVFKIDVFKICDQISDSTQLEKCNECLNMKGLWTAVGCINREPTNIVRSFIRIGLGLAGGTALLIILAAAFTLSTSQGDPKKVGDAKEMLTAAIIGLLFVVFSVTILQFIGVTILQIPGFGQ